MRFLLLVFVLVSYQGFCESVDPEASTDFDFLFDTDFDFLFDIEDTSNKEAAVEEPWLFNLDLSNAGRHGEYWGEFLSTDKSGLFKPFDTFFLGAYTDTLNAVYSLQGSYSNIFESKELSSWRWNIGLDLQDVHRDAFDWVIVLSTEQRERLISRSQIDLLDSLRFGDFYVVTIFDQFKESKQGMVIGLDGMLVEREDRFFELGLGVKWQRISVSYELISKLKVNASDTFCSRFPSACSIEDFCSNDESPSFNDPDDVNVPRDYCLLYSTTVPGDDQFDFLMPYMSIALAKIFPMQELYGRASITYSAANLMGTAEDLTVLGRPNTDNDFIIIDWQFSWKRCLNCTGISPAVKHRSQHLQISIQGQSSLGSILPPQMLAPLGGSATVRGYPESHISADTVVSLNMEYHWSLPESENSFIMEEVFLFVDAGHFTLEREGRLRFLANSYGLTDASNSLASMGLGTILALGESVTIDASIGYVLKEINRLETIATVQDFTLYGPENSAEVGDTTVHLNMNWIF